MLSAASIMEHVFGLRLKIAQEENAVKEEEKPHNYQVEKVTKN